jgi:hypothetical protein
MSWDEVMEEFLSELPLPPEQRRRILDPLTERQLARSFRQVRLDRHDHVLAKHSKKAYPLFWHPVVLMETLAEEPKAHDWRPIFIYCLSDAVSDYWSHVTEGHPAPPGSAEDYLSWLVRRMQRRRSWRWTRWQDRRVVQARGLPSVRAEG